MFTLIPIIYNPFPALTFPFPSFPLPCLFSPSPPFPLFDSPYLCLSFNLPFAFLPLLLPSSSRSPFSLHSCSIPLTMPSFPYTPVILFLLSKVTQNPLHFLIIRPPLRPMLINLEQTRQLWPTTF